LTKFLFPRCGKSVPSQLRPEITVPMTGPAQLLGHFDFPRHYHAVAAASRHQRGDGLALVPCLTTLSARAAAFGIHAHRNAIMINGERSDSGGEDQQAGAGPNRNCSSNGSRGPGLSKPSAGLRNPKGKATATNNIARIRPAKNRTFPIIQNTNQLMVQYRDDRMKRAGKIFP